MAYLKKPSTLVVATEQGADWSGLWSPSEIRVARAQMLHLVTFLSSGLMHDCVPNNWRWAMKPCHIDEPSQPWPSSRRKH